MKRDPDPPADERLERFLATLREESTRGPGRGLRRLARFARSGAGLARGVLSASRKGASAALDPRDLKQVEALVTRLGELKGLPMKLGQIMSYLEVELPEESRKLLGLLQTQSPATPFEIVEALLREDLGERADTLLASLDPVPIAVASIGQVHHARLPDGTEVAVKVRHPEIEAAIRSDFKVAAVGTGMAGLMMPGMGATARDFVGEVQERLLEECDYALEAKRQERFGALYEGHPRIRVPAVHPEWCGPRVLTTTWATGQDFESFRETATQEERDLAGEILFDFYLGTLYRHGLFHADPHPGNYLFGAEGQVVVFDYGCVRVFEPEVAHAFVTLGRAVQEDDREAICAALRGFGAEPSRNDATYARLRRLLRGFFGPMLEPGKRPVEGEIVIDMGEVMKDKLALARLRLPGRLVFLFRIRFGLYAVLSRLGSVCDWSALEQALADDAEA